MQNRKIYDDKYRKSEKGKAARARWTKKYYDKTAGIYPRRNFTSIEDFFVYNHIVTDTQLSSIIHRSVKSIQRRRNRLKKIEEEKNVSK